jgi:GTP pyrophosphokinase
VLDFAYAIHTNVGDRTLKAKIDQTNVGLDTELKSGQTIETRTTDRVIFGALNPNTVI